MSLQAQLESLKEETIVKITAAQDLKELNQIRVETLGKKGPITEVYTSVIGPFFPNVSTRI